MSDDFECDGDHAEPVCADPECWLLPPVDLLTPSAPERIWLCISDDEDHYAEPFPSSVDDEVTWSIDRPCACTVEYTRADIAAARLAEAEALLREARGHLQYGTQPSDLFLRIDAFLGAKP